MHTALVFALILGAQVASMTKQTRSVRAGDFLVTATRVWLPSSDKESDRYHLVAVEVTVKNVSERVSHTHFYPSLQVKPYAEYPCYPWTHLPPGVREQPNLYELLPGEKSSGTYVFEVRNGTTPVALTLEYALIPQFIIKKPSINLIGLTDAERVR